MPQILPLTPRELADLRRLHGPPRKALEHVAERARMLVDTINRGEAMTGRAFAGDVMQLVAALDALKPPVPPLPPAWRPER